MCLCINQNLLRFYGKFHVQILDDEGDQSFEDIRKNVFNSNYSSLNTLNATTEDVFIFPEGYCKKITSDTRTMIRFHSPELIKVYVVDPYRENRFRTEESEIEGDFIGIVPQGLKFKIYLNNRSYLYIL